MDHSVRCSYAAGDLRAHAQLILEELPENPRHAIGIYLYDNWEADSISAVRSVLREFFEGGHWASSLLPPKNDPQWEKLMWSAEEARRALIMNGLPAWKEDSRLDP
jgi:hypothetical protein